MPSSLHIITSLAIVTTIHCLPSKSIIQLLNFFYLHKSIFTKNMIQENVSFLTFPLLKNNTHPWLFFSPYLSIFTCSSVDSASTFVSCKSLYKGTLSFIVFVSWLCIYFCFLQMSLYKGTLSFIFFVACAILWGRPGVLFAQIYIY